MGDAKRSMRVAGILAGGSGERFWPLSSPGRPKQLIRFVPGRPSMLEDAVRQLLPVVGRDHLLIVTSQALCGPIAQADLPIDAANILAEPATRNTGPSVAFLTAAALARVPERAPHELTVAVVTSDHIVDSDDLLRADIERAMSEAERTGALVCLGIPPARPETGFGYIEVGEEGGESAESHPVVRFHEKPDRSLAETYAASGRHLWNSGMLFARADALMAEMDAACPELGAGARTMQAAMLAADKTTLRATYEALRAESMDYAILERSGNVRVVEARFRWENMNAWDALGALSSPDDCGNVIIGDAIAIDVHDSVVYSTLSGAEMPVAVIGASGLVVVATEAGVLVMPRERAQQVREVAAITGASYRGNGSGTK